jgi:arginine exporter protein ArgO
MTTEDILGAGFNDPQARNAQVSVVRTVFISGMVGTLLGFVGGALLWKKHPVAGSLIGGLLVGPGVGYGLGIAIAAPKAAEAMQLENQNTEANAQKLLSQMQAMKK